MDENKFLSFLLVANSKFIFELLFISYVELYVNSCNFSGATSLVIGSKFPCFSPFIGGLYS